MMIAWHSLELMKVASVSLQSLMGWTWRLLGVKKVRDWMGLAAHTSSLFK
jgi:hypothetical protein